MTRPNPTQNHLPQEAGVTDINEPAPTFWEPGIPLYDVANHQYSQYLFNFRPDPPENSNGCSCVDAAGWPNPLPGRALPNVEHDPLELWIAEWHRWNVAQDEQESA